MRVWAPLVLGIGLCASAAHAQEEKGGLEGLIERSLSTDTMGVTVDGLSGALSSTAEIEKLTFSDPSGPWMTIEGARLNWSRAALLRGRVNVQELGAERITVLRTPEGEEAPPELPTAEAEPFSFSLPELPVSVIVESLLAEEVILEEPLLGERVVATVDASLRLEDGEGSVTLDLRRTDEEGTVLDLTGSFVNSTEALTLNLDTKVREGGLLARKSGVPGAPAFGLNVQGQGVLSDFLADLSFRLDDTERLAGIVHLTAESAEEDATAVDRTIVAELSGDLRQLVTAELQPFFGDDTALDLETNLRADGVIDVSQLWLRTSQLDLRSQLTLGEARWPERIGLVARLNPEALEPLRLPIPGTPTELSSAYVNLSFDANTGSVWSAVVSVSDLTQGEIEMEAIDLRAAGQLILPGDTEAGSVSGALSGGVSGLTLPGAAVQQAAGDSIELGTQFAWGIESPLDVTGMELRAGDVSATLDGRFDDLANGVTFDGQIALDAESLSRFGGLANLPLSGSVDVDVEGTATLLSGIFDLTLSGTGSDLLTGIEPVDALLGGRANIAVSANRSTDAFEIRQADVETEALNITASGGGTRADANLTLSAALDTLERLVPGVSGPANFDAEVSAQTDTITITATGAGPADLALDVDGTIASDFSTADISIDGATRLELAAPFINPRTAAGGVSYELALNGPLGLPALSGAIRLDNGRVADPTIGFALENLSGSATLGNALVNLDFGARGNRGGQLSVGGSLGLDGAQQADITVDIDALRFAVLSILETRLDGGVSLVGPLAGGALLSGQINLDQTEIRVPDGAGVGAEVAGLEHVNPPADVEQTLDYAGFSPTPPPEAPPGSGGTPIGLDILVSSPTQIFVRGFGLDAELGGEIEITGDTTAPIPVGEFELQRGRIDVLGRRLTLTEGRISLAAGALPQIRFVSVTETDEYDISVIVDGPVNDPEISVESSPNLPEDEALAQLLFSSDTSGLSALQAVQLANSLGAIRNGTGLGFFNNLREEAGLDDLDLTTDEDGQTSLRLGKYLSDDVYTNVDIDGEGNTTINLNIDLTPNITARGSTDTAEDNNSSIGLFFERDY